MVEHIIYFVLLYPLTGPVDATEARVLPLNWYFIENCQNVRATSLNKSLIPSLICIFILHYLMKQQALQKNQNCLTTKELEEMFYHCYDSLGFFSSIIIWVIIIHVHNQNVAVVFINVSSETTVRYLIKAEVDLKPGVLGTSPWLKYTLDGMPVQKTPLTPRGNLYPPIHLPAYIWWKMGASRKTPHRNNG